MRPVSPPGMPKTYSMPASSSTRTRAWGTSMSAVGVMARVTSRRSRKTAARRGLRAGRGLRRPAALPAGGLLVGPADAESHRLVARVADDLERQRQAAGREAVGHGEPAETEIVHR